ncbi:MAG: Hsp20/alpha crystallin family protein [Chloroflexi bacterium]|nr:Hsp20/alpha crystallin family protein [Chloroflexota bacterium]
MVRRPSTFGELISLRRTMDRVLDDPFFQMPMARQTRRMPLDVFDTPDALVLEAALPGVAPADIEVSVLGDVLTLTAGTDATDAVVRGGYQVREVRRGRMTRSVTLPRDLRTDEASASFENGMLRLSIPKATPVERRWIAISVPDRATEATSASEATPVTGAAHATDAAPSDEAAITSSMDA